LNEKLDLIQYAFRKLNLMSDLVTVVIPPDLTVLAFKLNLKKYYNLKKKEEEYQGCGNNIMKKIFRKKRNLISADEEDEINKIFLKRINSEGNILLSPLRSVRSKPGDWCIRLVILSFRSHKKHVDRGLADIHRAAIDVHRELELKKFHKSKFNRS